MKQKQFVNQNVTTTSLLHLRSLAEIYVLEMEVVNIVDARAFSCIFEIYILLCFAASSATVYVDIFVLKMMQSLLFCPILLYSRVLFFIESCLGVKELCEQLKKQKEETRKLQAKLV